MKMFQNMLGILILVTIIMFGSIVEAADYVLPRNASIPVITMDYQGDRLRRIDDAPTVSIFANGDVALPKSYAHSQAYRGNISTIELQELLSFIIRDNQFFDYDETVVKNKLSRFKRSPLPVHFSKTVISVNADNRQKVVSLTSLGNGNMVEDTNRMLAIQQRLDRLVSIVKLGGTEKVNKLLSMANSERNLALHTNEKALNTYGRQVMSEGLFTAADLQVGSVRADGSIHARFKRGNGAMATIDVDSNGVSAVMLATDN